MSEKPQAPESQEMLPYARFDDSGLAEVYRLVGWFYLALSIASAISAATSAVAMSARVGSSWLMLAQVTLPNLPRIVAIVGTLAMIQTRAWGAIFVSTTHLAGFVFSVFIAAFQYSAVGGAGQRWFMLSSLLGSLMFNIIHALLPLAMWRLGRQKGIFRP